MDEEHPRTVDMHKWTLVADYLSSIPTELAFHSLIPVSEVGRIFGEDACWNFSSRSHV